MASNESARKVGPYSLEFETIVVFLLEIVFYVPLYVYYIAVSFANFTNKLNKKIQFLISNL